jgi:anti-sigma-K factor RskA
MGRMELTHDEAKELVAPYVLGALPEEEVPFVRAHILSCDECMAEADSYSEVASQMALAVEPVDLPAGFAERVMKAAVGDTARTEVASSPKGAGWSRWRPRLVPLLSSTAAILAIAILGFSLVQANQRVSDIENVVSAIIHSDGTYELNGEGATARVLPSSEGSIFVAAGMREAPDGHTYELWFMDGDTPVSIGTFEATDGLSILETEHDVQQFDGVAVTVEQEGGSPSGLPTTDPIMVSAS